ncbi:peptidase M16 [Porphyromonas macacae]|uniref:Peptidase M16 n=1 Tax=Porphyromonas macacae TaxID=28115 RepID=A0A0A2EBN9_9PORP|nr:pitrilysin family protein [Porphyromonas macacae]KGN75067.1 peptidase M16 [Porphyromonas macacae]
MEYITEILPSGLKIAYFPDQSEVTYLGYGIGVGSRHENNREHGLAHFTEHMLFKGTGKRSAKQIIFRMEEVGADLNAFTTKEETFLYAAFSKRHLNRAMELMSDIVLHSAYPEKELQKEKEVIIDEINSYKDTPAELIYDEFENLLFKGRPLGHNILGTEQSVRRVQPASGRQFLAKHYRPDNMLLFVMGQVDFERLVEQASYYFPSKDPVPRREAVKRKPFVHPCGQTIRRRKDTYQHHTMIGNLAYAMNDKRRYALSLMTNILGGPGMNSQLNMLLREENGLVYNVEAGYTAYSDTGVFHIYYGCAKQNAAYTKKLVLEALEQFICRPLTEQELTAAKQQLKGQLAISNDNRENVFLSMGKSLMHFEHFNSLSELYLRIDSITADDIFEVAKEVLNPARLLTLEYA